MASAALRSLSLTDFRSYRTATLALESGAVVLFGPNGAGKTNLLEAISLLAPGKGLRNAAAAEVGRREPGEPPGRPWTVSAQVEGADGEPVRLGTGLEPGASRRTVRIEGETTTAARLSDHVRLVWLTPAQDRLFAEPASERRRFLDRLTFAAEPAHAAVATAYEGALRQRMRLLLDARESGRGADPVWLDALEARMAQAGEAVAAARARTVEALQAEIDARADRPFPQAGLSLSGEWSAPAAYPGDDGYGDALRSALRVARGRDAAAGRGLVGPHRADLEVVLRGKARPAAEGSTGEQKALVLNLVLAQAARLSRVSEGDSARAKSVANPILLLDEIAAHLDSRRRAALFDEITALRLQAFLTGADPALFEDLKGRAQHVHVHAGGLDPR